MAMLPVEPDRKAVHIPDGEHRGLVTEVVVSEKPFEGKTVKYLDLTLMVNDVIGEDGTSPTIRAGYPLSKTGGITPQTLIGQFLTRMGVPIQVGGMVNSELLRGRMVSYLTVAKPSKRDPTKVYSEVVRESVKPYPPIQKM